MKTVSISPLKEVTGIAVDQQGNVFTGDSSGNVIYRIDVDAHISTFVKDADGVRGLAFGPDGRLYGCDSKGISSYGPEGKKSVRLRGVYCNDIAFTRRGGLYFSYSHSGIVGYVPPGNSNHLGHGPSAQFEGLDTPKADGICFSPDQSMFYVTDSTGKWVWSYQIQADGKLANGEPYFRMETPDESSASGAAGIAADSQGLVFVATSLGIQVCDEQGRVTAILNPPEQIDPSLGPLSELAFGGRDHEYLYAVVGNKVYRRHLVRRGSS